MEDDDDDDDDDDDAYSTAAKFKIKFCSFRVTAWPWNQSEQQQDLELPQRSANNGVWPTCTVDKASLSLLYSDLIPAAWVEG